jgi:hypothetical protein
MMLSKNLSVSAFAYQLSAPNDFAVWLRSAQARRSGAAES